MVELRKVAHFKRFKGKIEKEDRIQIADEFDRVNRYEKNIRNMLNVQLEDIVYLNSRRIASKSPPPGIN
jgi:hypothetical protein